MRPLHNHIFLQIYHACDGPGLSILCFMQYDILEYFSIYGTALSMWVSLMGKDAPLFEYSKVAGHWRDRIHISEAKERACVGLWLECWIRNRDPTVGGRERGREGSFLQAEKQVFFQKD